MRVFAMELKLVRNGREPGRSNGTADLSTALRSGRDDKGKDGASRASELSATSVREERTRLGSIPATVAGCPTPPISCGVSWVPWTSCGSPLKRAAHAVLSRAAYRKFGASRSFFARCGIPRVLPSSLSRADRTSGVPHVRTSVRGPKKDGRSPPQLFVPDVC
jgi:hypothetical protein